jgi:hypothetical protein
MGTIVVIFAVHVVLMSYCRFLMVDDDVGIAVVLAFGQLTHNCTFGLFQFVDFRFAATIVVVGCVVIFVYFVVVGIGLVMLFALCVKVFPIVIGNPMVVGVVVTHTVIAHLYIPVVSFL